MKKSIIIVLLLPSFYFNLKSQCYQPWVINPNIYCITLWDPVCGCDGKIYSNSCVAYNHYGITSWKTSGDIVIDGPRTMCKGDTIRLTASGGLSYFWNTGSNSGSILVWPESNRRYEVNVYFSYGCSLSRSIDIKVNPAFEITENITITKGETYCGWETPGTYTRKLKTVTGCDSIVTTLLTAVENYQINLKAGWNIISIYTMPTQTKMDILFQNLIDNGTLIKIQDQFGNAFENMGAFGGWVNNIEDIKLTEGYKVKVANDCQLQFKGAITGINQPVEIALKAGWNMMGYPKTTVRDAMDVIQQLIDRKTLVKVQDEMGNSIEDLGVFGGWTNFIGTFKPGKGYKIKVSKDEILTF